MLGLLTSTTRLRWIGAGNVVLDGPLLAVLIGTLGSLIQQRFRNEVADSLLKTMVVVEKLACLGDFKELLVMLVGRFAVVWFFVKNNEAQKLQKNKNNLKTTQSMEVLSFRYARV